MEDGRLDILIGKGPTARLHTPGVARVHARRRYHPHRTRLGATARPIRFRRAARSVRHGRPPIHRRAVGPDPEGRNRRRGRRPDIGAVPRHTPWWRTASSGGSGTSPRCAARATSTAPPRVRASSSSGWTSWVLTRSIGPSSTLCARGFEGQPVGLTTLAQCVGEEPDTIEDADEPYLVQSGFDPAHLSWPGRHSARAWATSGTRDHRVARSNTALLGSRLPAWGRRCCCSRRADRRRPRRPAGVPLCTVRAQPYDRALPFQGCTTRRKRGDQMAGMRRVSTADSTDLLGPAARLRCAGREVPHGRARPLLDRSLTRLRNTDRAEPGKPRSPARCGGPHRSRRTECASLRLTLPTGEPHG